MEEETGPGTETKTESGTESGTEPGSESGTESKAGEDFLREAKKRLGLIKKDVQVMHSFYNADFEGRSMEIPFNLAKEDLTEEQWSVLNQIEDIRKLVFTTCMGMLVKRKP